MKEAEIKLSIFRAIDQLNSESLNEIYQVVQKLLEEAAMNVSRAEDIEVGYKAMSQDEERESEALLWSEGTLNPNDL